MGLEIHFFNFPFCPKQRLKAENLKTEIFSVFKSFFLIFLYYISIIILKFGTYKRDMEGRREKGSKERRKEEKRGKKKK